MTTSKRFIGSSRDGETPTLISSKTKVKLHNSLSRPELVLDEPTLASLFCALNGTITVMVTLQIPH